MAELRDKDITLKNLNKLTKMIESLTISHLYTFDNFDTDSYVTILLGFNPYYTAGLEIIASKNNNIAEEIQYENLLTIKNLKEIKREDLPLYIHYDLSLIHISEPTRPY